MLPTWMYARLVHATAASVALLILGPLCMVNGCRTKTAVPPLRPLAKVLVASSQTPCHPALAAMPWAPGISGPKSLCSWISRMCASACKAFRRASLLPPMFMVRILASLLPPNMACFFLFTRGLILVTFSVLSAGARAVFSLSEVRSPYGYSGFALRPQLLVQGLARRHRSAQGSPGV